MRGATVLLLAAGCQVVCGDMGAAAAQRGSEVHTRGAARQSNEDAIAGMARLLGSLIIAATDAVESGETKDHITSLQKLKEEAQSRLTLLQAAHAAPGEAPVTSLAQVQLAMSSFTAAELTEMATEETTLEDLLAAGLKLNEARAVRASIQAAFGKMKKGGGEAAARGAKLLASASRLRSQLRASARRIAALTVAMTEAVQNQAGPRVLAKLAAEKKRAEQEHTILQMAYGAATSR